MIREKKNEPQAIRECQDQEPNEGTHLTYQQQRAAARMVRQPAQHRSGDQLAERVSGYQEAHHRRRGAEMLGIEWQQRQDDRQAEDINRYDQENRNQGRFTQAKSVRW